MKTKNMAVDISDIKKQHVIKLSEVDHVLLRPSRYIGSMEPILESRFILNTTTNKLEWREVKYIPAILKCFREILDNSVDECEKCTKNKLKGIGNRIDIKIEGCHVSVEDNGRGIPVEKNSGGEWLPELCWTSLRAGSKFEDDSAAIGQNGEGASLVAIFSKEFIGESSDGKSLLKLTCTENMHNKKIDVKQSTRRGVYVSYELGGKGEIKLPEKNKEYNLDVLAEAMESDPVYQSLIMTDIILLSIVYPLITFKVNGKEVKFKKFSEFASMLGDEGKVEILDCDNVKVAISTNPTAQYNFIQFINGVNACDGGGPLDWVVNSLTSRIVEKLQKRYKNIKPSDVKNHITFATFFINLPNPRFSNQTKTHCVNTASQFSSITTDVDFDKLAKLILKNDLLIEPMIETYKIKEEFEKRKALAEADKNIGARKARPKNYMAATEYNEYLVLTEGESAKYGIAQVLGRDRYGFFGLRGKPLNCYDTDIKRIADNKEIAALRQILSINFSNPNASRLTYENILVASDSDLDGMHIRALVLTMFGRLAKELVKKGCIKVLRTPLVTLNNSKGEIMHYFFDTKSLNEWKSNNAHGRLSENYFKGLGKWGGENAEPLLELMKRDGIGNFIIDMVWDDTTDEMFDAWMNSANADKRKEMLNGLSLDISLQ